MDVDFKFFASTQNCLNMWIVFVDVAMSIFVGTYARMVECCMAEMFVETI